MCNRYLYPWLWSRKRAVSVAEKFDFIASVLLLDMAIICSGHDDPLFWSRFIKQNIILMRYWVNFSFLIKLKFCLDELLVLKPRVVSTANTWYKCVYSETSDKIKVFVRWSRCVFDSTALPLSAYHHLCAVCRVTPSLRFFSIISPDHPVQETVFDNNLMV